MNFIDIKFVVHVLLNHLLQSMLKKWWPDNVYYKNEWRQEKVSAILCAPLLIFSPPFPMNNVALSQSSVFHHFSGCSGLRVSWRSISSDSLFSEWQYPVRWHVLKWNSNVYKYFMLELKLCWLRKLHVVSRHRIRKLCITTRVWNSYECRCNGRTELWTSSSSSSSCSWRVSHVSLFLDPQDEVGPSISSSVVLCFFVRLVYIVVLVLVVCLCPSSLNFEQKAQIYILPLSSLGCAARNTEVT